MTTNQTIDGVPRELLERAISATIVARGPGSPTERDLRALLDAPTTWECTPCKVEQPTNRPCDVCERATTPAAPPQGKPVACMPVERCYDVRAKMIIAFNETKKSGGDLDGALGAAYESALRYSPNPVNAEQRDRSPEANAIEDAEYMAKSADDVLAKFQAYGLALLAVDEGGDDGEGEFLENIDSTRGDLQESLVDLRSMVYEFRKRAAKS